MHLIVNGRNIELTDAIKQHAEQKVSRLTHHYDFILEVHVFLSVEKNPSIHNSQLAEATVQVPGAVVRVEASCENLYTSIDKLIDKIDRALRKHKTKLLQRAKSGKSSHGESIRTVGLEEDLAAEAHAQGGDEDDDLDLEGVTLTYEDEEAPANA